MEHQPFTKDHLEAFLLQHTPALSQLKPDRLAALVTGLTLEVLSPGEVLFRQGEDIARLYWIHSGLLDEEFQTSDGKSRRMSWSGRGDIIGLQTLMTGEPASKTLSARRHVVLVSVALDLYSEILLASRNVFLQIASNWRERAVVRTRKPRPGAFVYACLAEAGVDANKLEAALQDLCTGRSATSCITRNDVLDESGDLEIGPSTISSLYDTELSSEIVIYSASEADPDWYTFCQKQADNVHFFLPEIPTEELVGHLRAALGELKRAELVVTTDQPEGVEAEWAEAFPQKQIISGTAMSPDELRMGLEVTHDLTGRPARLGRYELFSDLNERELELVSEEIEWLEIEAGTEVFTCGSPSEYLYFVESGRFRAFSEGDELIAEIGPGEYFGETTALTEPTAWVTVKASRDSLVGRLSANRFRALLEEFPKMARGLSRVLARRFRETEPLTAQRPPKQIAIVSLNREGPEYLLSRELAQSIGNLGIDCCIVDQDFLERELGAGMANASLAGAATAFRKRWFSKLEESHEVIVCLATNDGSYWTEQCLRNADMLLLVADAGSDPGLRPFEQELLDSGDFRSLPHLVLLQPAGIKEASQTRRWLDLRPGVTHHHVRAENVSDQARVIRRALRRAVGVAFSGASSRGVAHLGVLRAMETLGLPFDLASGSSSGAAAAAMSVLGLSQEEMLERALRFVESVGLKLSNLQPPLTSIMSGKAFSSYLQEEFGDHRLEDQMIPCTLTGVDLNRHVLVRMNTGPIWLAVRASCSLPLFWPPVWRGDDLLVDGGLMSYLPVTEILDECAGGLAIASDLDVNAGKDERSFAGYENYGDTLSSWKMMAERLTKRGEERLYPTITQVLFHSMCLPSFAQQKRLRELSSFDSVRFVRPPLQHSGFFTVDAEAGRKIEQLAFEEAMKQLEGVASKV